MTQKSFLWPGSSGGDAALAPMSAEDFADFFFYALEHYPIDDGTVLASSPTAILGDTIGGTMVPIRASVIGGVGNNLEVDNYSGLNVRIETGAAIVDGRLYYNDAQVLSTLLTAPGSGTNYYAFGLEANFTAQTVRAVVQGPSTTVAGLSKIFDSERKSASYFATLAIVGVTSGSVVTVYDCRRFVSTTTYQTIAPIARQGGNADYGYYAPGTNTYDPGLSLSIMPIHIKSNEIIAAATWIAFMQNQYGNYPIAIVSPRGTNAKQMVSVGYGSSLQVVVTTSDDSTMEGQAASGIILGGTSSFPALNYGTDPISSIVDSEGHLQKYQP